MRKYVQFDEDHPEVLVRKDQAFALAEFLNIVDDAIGKARFLNMSDKGVRWHVIQGAMDLLNEVRR